ncbi:MAG: MotA/TolQ/ExbB proton channel family protein [Kiritimatiellae bacterium]|nr:MotA/TolQ/ExbB proton channel family protein [Kiritimatiellia bacterium]
MNAAVQAFFNSDLFNQAVVVLLVFMSVLAWAMMRGKRRQLRAALRKDASLDRRYRNAAHPAAFYVQAQGHFQPDALAAAIYAAAMKELLNFLHRYGVTDEAVLAWQPGMAGPSLPESEMATVRAAAESALAEKTLQLESRMAFLSACTSAATSLGLLGTVWGIMRAFMDMVGGGSAIVITAVAPGIAGALLTTVVGLLVAIPSQVGYNLLFAGVHRKTTELEVFTDRLLADIVRIHGASVSGGARAAAAPAPYAAPAYAAPAPAYAPAPAPVYAAPAPVYAAPAPAPAAPTPPSAAERFG